jgi:hypothetical protein
MNHLQFKTSLCALLMLNWKGRDQPRPLEQVQSRPTFCMPSYNKKKRRYCVVFKVKKTFFLLPARVPLHVLQAWML